MTSSEEDSQGCCLSLTRKGGLRILWELGKGGQGIVFLCTDQAQSNVQLACKTIRSHPLRPQQHATQIHEQTKYIAHEAEGCNSGKRRKLNALDGHHNILLSSNNRKRSAEEVYEDTQLRWEAKVLQHLSGIPGVLPLVSTFEGDDGCFHLVTAFCDAGNLLSKLDSRPPLFRLPHHEAAPIVASLARTLASCHARGIIHRDIKPGNILFRRVEGKEREEEVVIADFGLAATITPGSGETLCDRVGTARYQAPEVIQGKYDHCADIWSLGIIMHLLLTSTLPFNIEHLPHDAPDSAIQHAILCNELNLEGLDLSASAQDLLTRILCKEPKARLSLGEVLCHPWLQVHNSILEPIGVASTQTKSAVTTAPLTDSRTSSPLQHGVRQRVGGHVDEAGTAPKAIRVRLPMGRKAFRQQWGNAIQKAAIA